MIRAFFAVDIEDKDITQKIVSIQKDLEDPNGRINFVAKENLHFTLKFLGDIEESIVPKLQSEFEKIASPSFSIELKGMGCLPSFEYINAIYIDITNGNNELSILAKKIEEICSQFNLRKEKRPFKCHLTIGRVKKIGNKSTLVNKIKQNKEEFFGSVKITNFRLKKSVLEPTGPNYTNLFEIKLEE
ncbi:MAG TPA: RNA 2',3'-cyclic phosphodiesterase [candidate division Zixibacteria bacterium]|nr:RNA 2',3'-cyclic phosphodiesterase [candidate division Zixibacteria bacterium]